MRVAAKWATACCAPWRCACPRSCPRRTCWCGWRATNLPWCCMAWGPTPRWPAATRWPLPKSCRPPCCAPCGWRATRRTPNWAPASASPCTPKPRTMGRTTHCGARAPPCTGPSRPVAEGPHFLNKAWARLPSNAFGSSGNFAVPSAMETCGCTCSLRWTRKGSSRGPRF